jgi:hypothetical protein
LIAFVAALALVSAGFATGKMLSAQEQAMPLTVTHEVTVTTRDPADAAAAAFLAGFRERAAKSAAMSYVRASIPSVEAYASDNGSNGYAGATATVLRQQYDSGLSRRVRVVWAHTDGYCIEAKVQGATAHKAGPEAAVLLGPCP